MAYEGDKEGLKVYWVIGPTVPREGQNRRVDSSG